MLKELFTSQVRIKLLELFTLHPKGQFYVRELTRILEEQINSVRRELDNLTKVGFLKSVTKNRRKYFRVNTQNTKFADLKSFVLKNANNLKKFIKECNKNGSLDLLLFAGAFIQESSPFDIYIVGEINSEKLKEILTKYNLDNYKIQLIQTEDFATLWQQKDIQTISIIKNSDYIKAYSNLDEFL